VLTLSTPYYAFEHDLKKGGALSRVTLTHGKAKNILVSPLETRVRLVQSRAADAAQFGRTTGANYSDINDRSAMVSQSREGTSEVVTVEASLADREGKPSGIRVKTTYNYRWGYAKVRKEFLIAEARDVVAMTVMSALFDRSLSNYGYRPAAMEEMENNPFGWTNG